MKLHRTHKWLAACVLAVSAGCALAQTYPDRPIKIIVPFAPAGNVDVMVRALAPALEADLKQPVVVENLPGASGAIGSDKVAKAKADGYTVLANSSIHVILPSVQKLAYDPMKDFVPVSQITSVPLVLNVASTLPVKNFREFQAWAKEQPGAVDYATFIGASTHLASELLGEQAGMRVNAIPYKVGTAAIVDVAAGRVPFMFEALLAGLPNIKSGKLRPLAVTGSVRSPMLPDVPTFEELGIAGMDANTWHAFWVPKGTPQPVIDRLSAAMIKAAQQPAIKERIEALGTQVIASTPAEFSQFTDKEYKRWAALIKRAGIELK